MKNKDRILIMFPMMFFLLGLFTQVFVKLFDDLWWGAVLIGLVIYGYLYYWFLDEYYKEIK